MLPRRLLLLLPLLFGTACVDSPRRIDGAERRATIAALSTQIDAHYIDSGAGRRLGALLRARERTGAYDAIHDETLLAQHVSRDLLQASHDPRLRVAPRAATSWWWRLRDQAGIGSYQQIAADIGYIDVTDFVAPARSARRLAHVFGDLAGVRTLIVDLRNNSGGDADGLQLLASYMVDRPIHYAALTRRDGQVEARWALPQLASRPYLEQLTILIGPRTSAEAENFAFAMQAWKRARLVGSRSAGVSTATRAYPVSAGLDVQIPDARVTLPLTGTAWEGGVVPDLTSGGDARKLATRQIVLQRLAHVTTPMGRAALLAMLKEL